MAEEYTISHAGGVLDPNDEGKVTVSQNQVAPQLETPILSWECPRNFEQISYVGNRDATRFVPRTVQSITGSANDDTVVTLNNDIQPIHGERDLADQDYPVCVAYNVTTGTEYDIVDVDYAANTVTLGTDPADGDTVKLWPIMTEGTIKFRGIDQLNVPQGAVYPHGFPIFRFHDMRQLQAGRELNLHGAVDWTRHETVEVVMDAPQQIVWTDADYPRGDFVSTLEQDVEITL